MLFIILGLSIFTCIFLVYVSDKKNFETLKSIFGGCLFVLTVGTLLLVPITFDCKKKSSHKIKEMIFLYKIHQTIKANNKPTIPSEYFLKVYEYNENLKWYRNNQDKILVKPFVKKMPDYLDFIRFDKEWAIIDVDR